MKQICSQCGKQFELSESEKQFYKSKGLELPKRCKSCREANRENSSANTASGASGFWMRKPLWFSVLALALIVAASLFFGRNGAENSVPAVSGEAAGGVISVTAEPADSAPDTALPIDDAPPDNPETADSGTAQVLENPSEQPQAVTYSFRSDSYLRQHFEKHGDEFGYADEQEYLAGANRVINDPAALTKTEKEDGDYVFYLEDSNEFVILSTDGYIRTYFRPSSGLDYFNRQ